jgi:hypothetical protein
MGNPACVVSTFWVTVTYMMSVHGFHTFAWQRSTLHDAHGQAAAQEADTSHPQRVQPVPRPMIMLSAYECKGQTSENADFLEHSTHVVQNRTLNHLDKLQHIDWDRKRVLTGCTSKEN